MLFWFYKDLRGLPEPARFPPPREPRYKDLRSLRRRRRANANSFTMRSRPSSTTSTSSTVTCRRSGSGCNGDLMLAAWYEERGRDVRVGPRLHGAVGHARTATGPDVGPAARFRRGVAVGCAPGRRRRTALGVVEGRPRAAVPRLSGSRMRKSSVTTSSRCHACSSWRACRGLSWLPTRSFPIRSGLHRISFADARFVRSVSDSSTTSDSPLGGPGRRRSVHRRDANDSSTGRDVAIVLPTVLVELTRSDGARVFHPYHGLFPMNRALGGEGAALGCVRGCAFAYERTEGARDITWECLGRVAACRLAHVRVLDVRHAPTRPARGDACSHAARPREAFARGPRGRQ